MIRDLLRRVRTRLQPALHRALDALGPAGDPPAIHVEATPNPDALKFVLDRDLGSSRSRRPGDGERGDRLGDALVGVRGVRAIFTSRNFVTVERESGADWTAIRGAVEGALRDHA